MDFNYQELGFTCQCGVRETHVTVGVSSLVELILKWKCTGCGKDIMARIAIEDIVRDVPAHPEPRLLMAPAYTAEDVSLLADMNITLEESNE